MGIVYITYEGEEGTSELDAGFSRGGADSGKTISLKKGENFTVSLREDPSAGYLWELNLSSGLSILDDEYIKGQNPENLTGVPGTHLWVIEATAPGSQKVNGIYKRSWENITGTEEKFTLNVEVK